MLPCPACHKQVQPLTPPPRECWALFLRSCSGWTRYTATRAACDKHWPLAAPPATSYAVYPVGHAGMACIAQGNVLQGGPAALLIGMHSATGLSDVCASVEPCAVVCDVDPESCRSVPDSLLPGACICVSPSLRMGKHSSLQTLALHFKFLLECGILLRPDKRSPCGLSRTALPPAGPQPPSALPQHPAPAPRRSTPQHRA